MTSQSGRGVACLPHSALLPVPGNHRTPSFPGRPRRRLWLAVAIAMVLAGTSAGCGSGSGSSAGPPPSPTGPKACVLPGATASTSSHWKIVLPRTLCGLPQDNTAEMLSAGQDMVSVLQSVLSTSGLGGPSAGNATSSHAQAYQLSHAGIYRSITFVGLGGRFSPAAAVAALSSSLQDSAPFRSVPPGPHGGAMECALMSGTLWECVWATTSTVGEFQIIDTTNELTGSHLAANAVRIREAVEVPA